MLGIDNPWVIGAKWAGLLAQKSGCRSDENPHVDGELLRRLWSRGFQEAEHGEEKPKGSFDSYWVTAPCQPGENYKIQFGCAFLAKGETVAEAATLDEAKMQVPRGARIYQLQATTMPGLFSLVAHVRGRRPHGREM